jgi:uncharacterized protein
MTLEAYATALFDHWGVGKAETNDGVMVLSSATTAPCGWNWARPTGATGTAWRRTWWNAISSTHFATGDYVRGITWGTEQTIERIVLPFREGAAPPRRAAVCATGSSGSACSGPSFWPCRADGSATCWRACALPAMRPPGAAPDRSVLTAATGALHRHGRTDPNLPLLRFRGPRRATTSPSAGPPRAAAFGGGRSGGGGASGRW